METPTTIVARNAAHAYFEYRTALAGELRSIPDVAEARQVAHAIAVQLAVHQALQTPA